jgi:hypothetical protein
MYSSESSGLIAHVSDADSSRYKSSVSHILGQSSSRV